MNWRWRNILPATKSDIDQLKIELKELFMELTDLETQIKANTDAEQSAIVLINGLATKIESLKSNPAKLQALADSLKASAENLAAAVVANTPASQ